MIRVGSLVKIDTYPPGLTDLSGQPVIEPDDLLGGVWVVCRLETDNRFDVDLEPGNFTNRAGQRIHGHIFTANELTEQGYTEPRLCPHLNPYTTRLKASGASITVWEKQLWGGTRMGIMYDRPPKQDTLTEMASAPHPLELWRDDGGGKFGATTGFTCHECGDVIRWPDTDDKANNLD